MGTTETATRGRGRPREFDADEVLDRAVETFWSKGFEATSMSDLVEATGLNKSSLYNSFGSKEELFQTAVERYVARRQAMMNSVVRDGTAGIDDILTFLHLARAEMDGELGARGCMALKTTSELGTRDESVAAMSTAFRDGMRTNFRAALDRAATAGEVRADSAASSAEVLVAFVLALHAFATGGASPEEVDAQFAAMRSTVDSWRLPT